MEVSDVQIALTLQGAADVRLTRNLSYAGYFLLVYDFLATIPDEVDFIWNSKRSFVKYTYCFNRYVSLIYFGFMTAHLGGLFYFEDRKFCLSFYSLAAGLNIIVLGNLHALMMMRTWVVLGRRRLILTFLLVLMGIIFVTVVTILGLALHHVGFDGFPLGAIYKTCIPSDLPWYTWVTWIPTMMVEIILLVLMMSTIRHHMTHFRFNGRSPLIRALFRDAVVYFIVVMFTHIFYVTVLVDLKRPTRFLLPAVFSLSLVTVAGQRLVLNFRKLDRIILFSSSRSSSEPMGTDQVFSTMAFEPNVLANTTERTQEEFQEFEMEMEDELDVEDEIELEDMGNRTGDGSGDDEDRKNRERIMLRIADEEEQPRASSSKLLR